MILKNLLPCCWKIKHRPFAGILSLKLKHKAILQKAAYVGTFWRFFPPIKWGMDARLYGLITGIREVLQKRILELRNSNFIEASKMFIYLSNVEWGSAQLQIVPYWFNFIGRSLEEYFWGCPFKFVLFGRIWWGAGVPGPHPPLAPSHVLPFEAQAAASGNIFFTAFSPVLHIPVRDPVRFSDPGSNPFTWEQKQQFFRLKILRFFVSWLKYFV